MQNEESECFEIRDGVLKQGVFIMVRVVERRKVSVSCIIL